MKTMRKLYDYTMEELDGVMDYAKCAMAYGQMDSELSKLYLTLAKTEMDHAKALHTMSQKKAAEAKLNDSEHVDPRLMELWEEMEQAKLDKMALAKACLDNAQG